MLSVGESKGVQSGLEDGLSPIHPLPSCVPHSLICQARMMVEPISKDDRGGINKTEQDSTC